MGKYDLDFHAWAQEQADAIRRRSDNDIDWENVAEEIESLGKQQAAELKNRYIALIAQLLKLRLQPERRGDSWRTSIAQQRIQIADHLEENPSLKAIDGEVFARAYRAARLQAAREMRRSRTGSPKPLPSRPKRPVRTSSGPRRSEFGGARSTIQRSGDST